MAGSAFERMLQAYQVISNIRQNQIENQLRTRQMDISEQQGRASAQVGAAEKLRNLWGVIQALPAEARPGIIQAMAQQLGVDPQAFVAAASATPEAFENVRNKKIAAGAASVPDAEVASTALTGQNLGQAAESGMTAEFIGSKGAAFGDVGKQAFLNSIARRGGQTVGQQAVDAQIPGMASGTLRNAAAMSLGLAPTAAQSMSHALGMRNADISNQSMENQYMLGFRRLEDDLLNSNVQRMRMQQEGKGGYGPNKDMTFDQWLKVMSLEFEAADKLRQGGLSSGQAGQQLDFVNRFRNLQGATPLSMPGADINWMQNIQQPSLWNILNRGR